jgi:hypothetical protein
MTNANVPLRALAVMSRIGRGCVKTQYGVHSQNFGPPECAVFDYFWSGKGRKTPEIEMAVRFYTASANCCRTATSLTAVVRWRYQLQTDIRGMLSLHPAMVRFVAVVR